MCSSCSLPSHYASPPPSPQLHATLGTVVRTRKCLKTYSGVYISNRKSLFFLAFKILSRSYILCDHLNRLSCSDPAMRRIFSIGGTGRHTTRFGMTTPACSVRSLFVLLAWGVSVPFPGLVRGYAYCRCRRALAWESTNTTDIDVYNLLARPKAQPACRARCDVLQFVVACFLFLVFGLWPGFFVESWCALPLRLWNGCLRPLQTCVCTRY